MSDHRLKVVFLVTRDVDALVRFYRDVVGLTVKRYEEGDSAWFDTGDAMLAIHRPEPAGGEGTGGDLTPETDTIVWLEPGGGTAAAAEALRAKGVALERPKDADNYFYFRDPEGRVMGFHTDS